MLGIKRLSPEEYENIEYYRVKENLESHIDKLRVKRDNILNEMRATQKQLDEHVNNRRK